MYTVQCTLENIAHKDQKNQHTSPTSSSRGGCSSKKSSSSMTFHTRIHPLLLRAGHEGSRGGDQFHGELHGELHETIVARFAICVALVFDLVGVLHQVAKILVRRSSPKHDCSF